MSLFAISALALTLGPVVFEDDTAYKLRITKWRAETEADLKKDFGWLTVAGLDWLNEGTTEFRTGKTGEVKLQAPDSEGSLGAFVRAGDQVSLIVYEKDRVLVNGKPGTDQVLSDSDRVTVGRVTMVLIRRGVRVGLRTYDLGSASRKSFKGQRWFPISTEYRVVAKFVPYPDQRTMLITNVLGDTGPVPNPGYVEFKLHGKSCRLEAQGAGSGLFLNFKDATSGKSTYPAGRFLDAGGPDRDGNVTLDFNQAVNPPCAFTNFATCPLPPAGNTLSVEVAAGEKTHHPGH